MYIKPAFFLILLLLSWPSISSDGAPASSQVILHKPQLESLVQRIYERFNATPQHNHQPFDLNAADLTNCSQHSSDSARSLALANDANNNAKRLGLSLNGRYSQGSQGDDSNTYLELSWDVLKGGYYDHKRKAKVLDYQSKLANIEFQHAKNRQLQDCQKNFIYTLFHQANRDLYSLKLDLIKPVYNIERRAYFNGWSYLDDLLISEESLFLTEKELLLLNTLPPSGILPATIPPILEINLNAVLSHLESQNGIKEIAELKKDILTLQEESTYDNRLRFFVRNEFDTSSSNNNNSNNGVTAGLRFSIPLERKAKSSLKYQHVEINENLHYQQQTQKHRLIKHFYDYQEQLHRTLKQQYRVERAAERVRRTFTEKRYLAHDKLPESIKRIQSAIDSSIELNKAKSELYTRLVTFFAAANIEPNNTFLKTMHHTSNLARSRTGTRAIYIWSTDFNKNSNPFIFDFLRAKSIKRVALSVGKKTNLNKAKDFIRLAKEHHIAVEIIIGSNNWVLKRNDEDISRRIIEAAELTGSIHLDIEPQTLPGYKENKADFLQKYTQLLTFIRQQIPNKNMTIAVSQYWPASTYKEIEPLSDAIYIMAYGTKKSKTIIRRLQKILPEITVRKAVLTLSLKDFDSEWELEKTIDDIHHQTGVRHYGLHQFKSFIATSGQAL